MDPIILTMSFFSACPVWSNLEKYVFERPVKWLVVDLIILVMQKYGRATQKTWMSA